MKYLYKYHQISPYTFSVIKDCLIAATLFHLLALQYETGLVSTLLADFKRLYKVEILEDAK